MVEQSGGQKGSSELSARALKTKRKKEWIWNPYQSNQTKDKEGSAGYIFNQKCCLACRGGF
jgi:hypothetical protein